MLTFKESPLHSFLDPLVIPGNATPLDNLITESVSESDCLCLFRGDKSSGEDGGEGNPFDW